MAESVIPNTLNEQISTTNEIECGTYNGQTLYKRTYVESTSTTTWAKLTSTVGAENIVQIVSCVRDSTGHNIAQPYYVSNTDMFRAGITNGGLYAQLGTTYPTKPATVICTVWYTK